ncbi:MAG: hypothetical protein HRT36_07330 [Alphaproteobacteria bacterium]|nr:hypothetical protein [Alphaproteobacteria bacterium]
MRDVTMPVWQFVRLMVKIEETSEQYNDLNLEKLYGEWEDFWADLDARLIDAGNRSREEFANMMMHQEVVMHRLDDIQIALIRRELTALIKQIKKLSGETEFKDDKRNLNYEWREIEVFLKGLLGVEKIAGLKTWYG